MTQSLCSRCDPEVRDSAEKPPVFQKLAWADAPPTIVIVLGPIGVSPLDKRLHCDGAIYHVAVRMLGNWKREGNLLFEDDADRERFVSRLAERVEQCQIRL